MSTGLSGLAVLFERDLGTLAREISAYPDDASLWAMVPGQPTPVWTTGFESAWIRLIRGPNRTMDGSYSTEMGNSVV